MVLYTIGSSIFAVICVIAGMVVFAYYAQMGCDPLVTGQIPNINQVRLGLWRVLDHQMSKLPQM